MVKWGVLGTANIAKGCTIPGMQLAKSCELYAIAGRNGEKANAFKDEFGFERAYGSYEELLDDNDVQAVYIPLPNSLHYKWVIAALEKGKHVLCEKPLGLNVDEVRKMHQTARNNGVILMEAYAYLHSPYIKSIKEDLKLIGEIDYIETAFLTQSYKEDIRLYKELGGGAMYDLGCYCTTMILTLINAEPTYVKANAEFSDLGVDILTVGMIGFDNGVRTSFTVGMNLGEDTDDRMDRLYIHGSKGVIKSEVEYNQAGNASYRIITGMDEETKTISIPQNYSLEIEQLCQCIEGDSKPHVSEDFSIRNAQLMDRIFKEIGY